MCSEAVLKCLKKTNEIDFYPLNIVNNFWTIDSRIVTVMYLVMLDRLFCEITIEKK